MSNDLVPDFETSDAFKHLDPHESIAEGITTGFSSIGYRGKVWSLRHRGKTYPFVRPDDGTPATFIDLVILDVRRNKSRVYFGAWNDDNASGPICASLNSDVPDAGVSIPQSKTCANCPNSQWGSGSGRGQACQEHKRMAVLLMPSMTKRLLEAPLVEPVFFKVPPGSFKSLVTYQEELTYKDKHWLSVITRCSFDQQALFQINFKAIGPLPNSDAPLVLALNKDVLTRQIVGSAIPRQIASSSQRENPPADTGLVAAFRKAESGKTIEHQPADSNGDRLERASAPAPAPASEKEAIVAAWEEGDTDLDARVAKALAAKMQGMMK